MILSSIRCIPFPIKKFLIPSTVITIGLSLLAIGLFDPKSYSATASVNHGPESQHYYGDGVKTKEPPIKIVASPSSNPPKKSASPTTSNSKEQQDYGHVEEEEIEHSAFDYTTTPSYESLAITSASPDIDCSNLLDGLRGKDEQKFVVILSGMDGKLRGLDAANGGRLLWTLEADSKPLLASTLADVELLSDGELFRLIPSLDGNMYLYQSAVGVVRAVPVSAESLISSSLRFGQDVVAGGRTVSTHGINVFTGELHYSCSVSDCDQRKAPEDVRNNLVVKRTSQTVRALDPSSGIEKWNVSVGELELMLSDPPDPYFTGESYQQAYCRKESENNREFWSKFEHIQFMIHPATGLVTAVDASHSNTILWESSIGSPIAQAWQVGQSGLKTMSLFDPSIVPYSQPNPGSMPESQHSNELITYDSQLYLGVYQGELYVIPSAEEKAKLESMKLISAMQGMQGPHFPPQISGSDPLAITNGPNSAESPSSKAEQNALVPRDANRLYLMDGNPVYSVPTGTAAAEHCSGEFEGCPTCSTNEVHALITRQTENKHDNGWYLLKYRTSPPSGPPSRLERLRWLFNRNNNNKHRPRQIGDVSGAEGGGLDDNRMMLTDEDATFYLIVTWGSASILLLAACMVISMYFFMSAMEKEREKSSENETVNTANSNGQKNGNSKADGTGSKSAPTVDAAPGLQHHESQVSTNSSELSSQMSMRSSRFLEDFEPIRILGKGGFGVVCEALNRVDNQRYAVKRIAVANNMKAKDRVGREVKALSSLDHPGIVRYYNAWFETHPRVWQRNIDNQIRQLCGQSMDLSGSTDLLSQQITTTNASKFQRSKVLKSNTNDISGLHFRHDNFPFSSNAAAPPKMNINSDDIIKTRGDSGLDNPNDCGDSDSDDTSWADFSVSSNKNNNTNIPVGLRNRFLRRNHQPNVAPKSPYWLNSDDSPSESGEPGGNPTTTSPTHRAKREAAPHKSSRVNEEDSVEIVFAYDNDNSPQDDNDGIKNSHLAASNDNAESSSTGSSSSSDMVGARAASTTESKNCLSSVAMVQNQHSKTNDSGGDGGGDVAAEVVDDENRLFLFITMTLCKDLTLGGWLHDNCESAESRPAHLMLDMFAQILCAVEFVHKFGLIHRDLKPSNIFFDQNDRLKIGDFGLATEMIEHMEFDDSDTNLSSVEARRKWRHTNDVGTRLYMSPEQLDGQSYTSKVDIYSLGLILLEMLVPFGTEMERRTSLTKARSLEFPSDFMSKMSNECSLVRKMLAINPDERPDCDGLIEDPILAEFFQNPEWIRSISSPAFPRRSRISNSSEKIASRHSKSSQSDSRSGGK